MLNYLAERYKTIIKRKYFSNAQDTKSQYAFIGTGNHATTQLYPVLQYLGVPLKYIHSRSIKNSESMCAIFKNCIPASDLETILNDDELKGVFVSTTPKEQFGIVRQLLEKNKDVFVEKPPCQKLDELNLLASKQHQSIFQVNLQQRYSPSIKILRKQATKSKFYRVEYLTGLYQQKDVLTDLFIHPLDIAIQLFGKIKICTGQKIITGSAVTYLLQLTHENDIIGDIKLSTAYHWQGAKETIEIHTGNSLYSCNFPYDLKRTVFPAPILGVPVDKILHSPIREEVLLNGHTISTSLPNHTSYLYGFYQSIEHFVDCVENNKKYNDFAGLKDLYELIEQLRKL